MQKKIGEQELMKIEIKSISGDVIFSHDEENNTVLNTVEKACLRNANLQGADLQYKYLEGARLETANLRGARLEGANLEGADLRYTDLRKACLRNAHLKNANLEDANLRGVDLRGVDLRGAHLKNANLRGARNIPKSFIDICSQQILYILNNTKSEIPRLKENLIRGNIDGTCYEGDCCCLIGTLGNGDNDCIDKVVSHIPYYTEGLDNPAEQWFFQIRKGDTPENSFFAKHALKLIEEVEN